MALTIYYQIGRLRPRDHKLNRTCLFRLISLVEEIKFLVFVLPQGYSGCRQRQEQQNN